MSEPQPLSELNQEILAYIEKQEAPVTAKQIARELMLEYNQATRGIAAIRQKGLIEKDSNNCGWMKRQNILQNEWLSKPWRMTG